MQTQSYKILQTGAHQAQSCVTSYLKYLFTFRPNAHLFEIMVPFKEISIPVFTDESLELHTPSKKHVKPTAKSSKVRFFSCSFILYFYNLNLFGILCVINEFHLACNTPVIHCVSLLLKNPSAKLATEPYRPNAAVRRPKRAAATTKKSYKELDTDGSLSESETPPVSKANTSPYQCHFLSLFLCCISTFEHKIFNWYCLPRTIFLNQVKRIKTKICVEQMPPNPDPFLS